jgi:octaprenyl-diphosphate synthase
MRIGAILGGATPEQEENLAQYGRDLGMAFQIVDDVLDLTASEDVLGKPVASDLREGKVTMAVIHALERCTPKERERIDRVVRERAFDGVTHGEILGPCSMPRWRETRFVASPTARLNEPCCGPRNS